MDINELYAIIESLKPISRIEIILRHICGICDYPYPEPMSRIELFLDAIKNGETIDIKPNSRNEKILQAIILGQNININPLSRAEKILLKIANADENIDDLHQAQSRYELYLLYILVSGVLNDDFTFEDVILSDENGILLVDENENNILLEVLEIRN